MPIKGPRSPVKYRRHYVIINFVNINHPLVILLSQVAALKLKKILDKKENKNIYMQKCKNSAC
jgi:hypothetical protein